MSREHANVVVLGAGLAGLRCARHLEERGIEWLLLEASDSVGGRVRTDEVDGHLLDRGFQVFLTAYPEARRVLDLDALDLASLYPGALVHRGGKFSRLADPFRRPGDALASLFGGVGTLRDKLAVLGLRRAARGLSVERLFATSDVPTAHLLGSAGLSEEMIEGFFRPFFAGVFLDPELATTSRMFRFVFKMLASGDIALPAAGMQAIPRQLAGGLPADRIRLGVAARGVRPGEVATDSGSLTCRAVVVATDPASATRLLPGRVRTVPMRPTATLYFAAEEPPVGEPILVLEGDGREAGPVNSLLEPSAAAPGYAPPGRSLVSLSVVDERHLDASDLEERAREQVRGWLGEAVDGWRPLATYRIPDALPWQPPGAVEPGGEAVDLGDGLFVAGDHRQHGSIEGALVSGRRAAEAVAGRLGAS